MWVWVSTALLGVVLMLGLLWVVANLKKREGASARQPNHIAFFFKRPRMSYLAFALGLSTGVMVYVSFIEILSKAREALTAEFGDRGAGCNVQRGRQEVCNTDVEYLVVHPDLIEAVGPLLHVNVVMCAADAQLELVGL